MKGRALGAATFVESWPGAGRGSQPSALQRWEGPLQKGPHPWGASSPGSSRGSCLPSSVQRHLLDSQSLPPYSPSDPVPQPRVLLGGSCCSPSQPPTPQACDAGARTPQPGGGSLLAPGHRPHMPGSRSTPVEPQPVVPSSPPPWGACGPSTAQHGRDLGIGPRGLVSSIFKCKPMKESQASLFTSGGGGVCGTPTKRAPHTQALAGSPEHPPLQRAPPSTGWAVPSPLTFLPKSFSLGGPAPWRCSPRKWKGGLLPVPPTGCAAPGPRCP